ncbi:MAG: hypothetical protein EZS28_030508 [Streblomastix strix]|uniref:Dynein heavy chain linker domain-containing protein n=1 Tax=Streblomastix strix TaxID=222440 RepID=A0A5J4UTH2_9EUKA|nr:MAG: hypothetical protein EZS28_030508 [Streblomastix strix]
MKDYLITEYPELLQTSKKFEGYYFLWTKSNNWSHWRVEWKKAEFEELDAISMEKLLTKAISNMARCQKLFREPPELLSVAQLVKGQIDELAPRIPMIVALRNPATRTEVIFGATEIQERLDMHLLRTQAMSFSPFKEPHKDATEKWLQLLDRVSLVVEELLKCQKRWIYLEPIFSYVDIQRKLPIEYK